MNKDQRLRRERNNAIKREHRAEHRANVYKHDLQVAKADSRIHGAQARTLIDLMRGAPIVHSAAQLEHPTTSDPARCRPTLITGRAQVAVPAGGYALVCVNQQNAHTDKFVEHPVITGGNQPNVVNRMHTVQVWTGTDMAADFTGATFDSALTDAMQGQFASTAQGFGTGYSRNVAFRLGCELVSTLDQAGGRVYSGSELASLLGFYASGSAYTYTAATPNELIQSYDSVRSYLGPTPNEITFGPRFADDMNFQTILPFLVSDSTAGPTSPPEAVIRRDMLPLSPGMAASKGWGTYMLIIPASASATTVEISLSGLYQTHRITPPTSLFTAANFVPTLPDEMVVYANADRATKIVNSAYALKETLKGLDWGGMSGAFGSGSLGGVALGAAKWAFGGLLQHGLSNYGGSVGSRPTLVNVPRPGSRDDGWV